MIPSDNKLIETALREDAYRNDITTLSIVAASARCAAKLVAKQDLTLAGIGLFGAVFKKMDRDIRVAKKFRDGASVPKGSVIAIVKGNARAILTGERTALNFLQRLCGIATVAASFVGAVAGTQTKILDTRKTTPGLRELEKYAVRMGGAENHRRDLSAMVLIKENHIAAAGGILKAVQAAKSRGRGRFIEVEVTSLGELAEALEAGADRVLLDNMTPAMVKKAVAMARGRAQTEASGNMTLATARKYAETGVDYISVGALTHSAPAADVSLLVEMRM